MKIVNRDRRKEKDIKKKDRPWKMGETDISRYKRDIG